MVEYTLPSVSDLHAYLRFKGWRELPPGPVGSLWVHSQARIGVPHDRDADLIQGAVERIALAEGRTPKEVADSVRYLLFDVTHLRAANDDRITDTIPLETAAKIISSARSMLRATATTARWERAHIGSNFSTIGNHVVKQVLMGHTEKGSFVIPVLVHLPEPPLVDLHEATLMDKFEFHRASPEPFERRVVRTFAQSMQAVQEIVVEPAREPSVDQVYELVYRGVSREFCVALSNILEEAAVSQFGSRVEWAPVVAPPITMPNDIAIDAEAVDLVKSVADKLRQQRVDPSQVFSGTIVQLRHENQDDPYGEIAVTTIRRGRQSEVLVRLPLDLYRQAWEWHYEGRAVLVEGVVERSPGRPLRVENPQRCHPVDEMFLPD